MERAPAFGRVTRLQSRRNRARENQNGRINVELEDDNSRDNAQPERDHDSSRDRDVPELDVRDEREAVGYLDLDSRANRLVSVVNGADSGDERFSDVEFLSATDSDDNTDDRRNSPSTAFSRRENLNNVQLHNMSTGIVTGSLITSPSIRLSNVANELVEMARQDRQEILSAVELEQRINREANNEEDEDNNYDEIVEVRSEIDDDEIEVLRETTSSARRNRNTLPEVLVIANAARSPEFVDISHEPVASRQGPEGVVGSNEAHESSVEIIPISIQNSTRNIAASNAEPPNDNNNMDASDSDDNNDEEGPPQKMPRLETSARSDEDDGCHICYEPFENSGGHRPCCLKCGHIFGKDCIERWIKGHKRCPDCNSKAVLNDVRVIYVKNLKAIDTAELGRMKDDIEKLKIEKNRVELTNSQLRHQVQLKNKELERLREENSSLLRSRSLKDSTVNFAEPTSSAKANEIASSSTQISGLRMPKLQPLKSFVIKEGQSRVGSYNEWMNLLVVTHSFSGALFPGGAFGVKKINCLDMKAVQSFPIHQRTIRDMAFSHLQNDLLLTVSLDKKAVLFNCNSNCPVQTFTTPTPLWSCCWNSVNHSIFYVASVSGQITSYDIRAPQEPLNCLTLPTTDKSGVGRLKFVPPAYQNQTFNMSGLLIQKLSSVWFCEMLGGSDTDPRYHQFPLEGPFLSADFEPESRHVLVTARPKQLGLQRLATSHTVCNLGKTYSETEERDIFSCDVVQAMTGGFQESSIMCRSAIFSPRQGQVYVAANGESPKTVRVWDVANIDQKTLLRTSCDEGAALDFVHGSVNETKFLGVIMDTALDLYDVK